MEFYKLTTNIMIYSQEKLEQAIEKIEDSLYRQNGDFHGSKATITNLEEVSDNLIDRVAKEDIYVGATVFLQWEGKTETYTDCEYPLMSLIDS